MKGSVQHLNFIAFSIHKWWLRKWVHTSTNIRSGNTTIACIYKCLTITKKEIGCTLFNTKALSNLALKGLAKKIGYYCLKTSPTSFQKIWRCVLQKMMPEFHKKMPSGLSAIVCMYYLGIQLDFVFYSLAFKVMFENHAQKRLTLPKGRMISFDKSSTIWFKAYQGDC